MIARGMPVNVAATAIEWVFIVLFVAFLVVLTLAPLWPRVARWFEPEWRGDE